jgi:hypothetical protein
MGIRVDQDRRHLIANLLGCALMLGLYEGALLLPTERGLQASCVLF